MSGHPRITFSEHEKTSLQELIIKYKLNSSATIGAGNPAAKKMAWVRLTQEFNSIESNSKRTEAQLKKCWDNLKIRRKQVLAQEKRERMRTGGGPCMPSSSRDSQPSIDAALSDVTNIELSYVMDSDMDMLGKETPLRITSTPNLALAPAATLDREISIQTEELAPVNDEHTSAEPQVLDIGATSHRASTPMMADTEEISHEQPASNLYNYEAPSQTTVPKNIRAHVINEEFVLRKEKYQLMREREEKLFALKLAEQEWLVKAAEEKFHKAQLDRQSGEELLRYQCAKRELAEMELAMARK